MMGRPKKYNDDENMALAKMAVDKLYSRGMFLIELNSNRLAKLIRETEPGYTDYYARRPVIKKFIREINSRIKEFESENLKERKAAEKRIETAMTQEEAVKIYGSFDLAWTQREKDIEFLLGAAAKDEARYHELRQQVEAQCRMLSTDETMDLYDGYRDKIKELEEQLKKKTEEAETYRAELDRLYERAILQAEYDAHILNIDYPQDGAAEKMSYIAQEKKGSITHFDRRRAAYEQKKKK